ncbi:hypothetical protein [Paractinoplanes deccanensis]|uniref:hypothetical protein n=1 Tax=Paractinoplanes deccanensis TaxID=113561 RepID=UPI0019426BAB|nr:hypothetical protein [Actinoplanes deccanensis]
MTIDRWHQAVNDGDLEAARRTVTDPVLVSGPRGTAPITRDEFAEWIVRSGIEIRATALHPITAHITVAEQEARWPGSPDWTRVATVFRVNADRVDAVLRYPSLGEALDAAQQLAGSGDTSTPAERLTGGPQPTDAARPPKPTDAAAGPGHATAEPGHATAEPSRAAPEPGHAAPEPGHAAAGPGHAAAGPDHAADRAPHPDATAEPPR